MSRFAEIGEALDAAALDGWLLYDFRLSDPLAYRILGLDQRGISTRRWFCLLRPGANPIRLVSAVEPHRLESIPGESIVYRSSEDLRAGLARMLSGLNRVAMDYSPNCAIPYVSRVDAGTVELVRSLGLEVVSAADLIQRFEAVLTPGQLASHRRAAAHLREIVDETFSEVARRISSRCDEYSIQSYVMERFSARGLAAAEAPIVAVNAHAADPHFAPSPREPAPIRRGDFVLLDLWAKEQAPDAIYADFTWVAFAGDEVPAEHARIFSIVANARNAAVKLIQDRISCAATITGREADRAARAVIENAGYGPNFVHRTGHSIGKEVHGTGANLDSLETDDHRALIANTCFSVEPGIYLPGQFGVRSEIDITIEGGRALVSADAIQREVVPLLARYPRQAAAE